MDKPMLVARREFAENLASLINNSGLHPVIVQPILQNTLEVLNAQLETQYQLELKQYQEGFQKENETTD